MAVAVASIELITPLYLGLAPTYRNRGRQNSHPHYTCTVGVAMEFLGEI